jgi:predicted nucleotidyltransferase
VLSKLDAIGMARKLRLLLEEQGVPVISVHLFGSAARGTMHRWSDVDIAVVCHSFKENPLREYCVVAARAYGIDPRISILYFRPEHFANPLSGIAQEVRREGIVVEE